MHVTKRLAKALDMKRLPRLAGQYQPSQAVKSSVINILRTFPNGASTKDIYGHAMGNDSAAAGVSEGSEHPYKSMR